MDNTFCRSKYVFLLVKKKKNELFIWLISFKKYFKLYKYKQFIEYLISFYNLET